MKFLEFEFPAIVNWMFNFCFYEVQIHNALKAWGNLKGFYNIETWN